MAGLIGTSLMYAYGNPHSSRTHHITFGKELQYFVGQLQCSSIQVKDQPACQEPTKGLVT